MEAEPHELISMLMQGVLDSCARARGLLDEAPSARHIAEKGAQVGRAISILETLRSCLDHEAGGEVSEKLDSLYEYMSVRLLMANAGNRGDWLDEVASLMREIKAGWDEIPQEARSLRSAEEYGSSAHDATRVLGTC
jgi:flagellar protein FliS